MFSNLVSSYLEKIGFYSNQFYKKISQFFSSKEYLFNNLIRDFYPQQNLTNEDFNSFSKSNNIDDELLNNTLFEVFNNIRNFRRGGKFEVFKYREAEWGLPSNVLNKCDIDENRDLDSLSDYIKVFRGMSHDEFTSSDFGQSWSTDYEIARRFAQETYSDKRKGIVATTIISKYNALYYDKKHKFEVIVTQDSIKKNDVFYNFLDW